MDEAKLAAVHSAADEFFGAAFEPLARALEPDRRPALEIPGPLPVSRIATGVAPDCAYRLAKEALDAAREEICLYIYNATAEHMLELLHEARRRGVRVRVMFDAIDTRGSEKKKLERLGVELQVAPSTGGRRVFTVCHQKYAVIDGAILLLGSANWAGTGMPLVRRPGGFKKANREWLVRVDDAPLAGWFRGLFEADWAIPDLGGRDLGELPPPSPPLRMPAALPARPASIFDIARPDLVQPAEVTPLVSPENYLHAVLALIRGAASSIDIEQQYIIASGPATDALLGALEQRRDQVAIRILVSPAYRKAGKTDSWELSVASLETFGLADCLQAMNLDYFTHLHNKGVLVDRRAAIVSSTNWSENSITAAREAGLLIESPEVAAYYAEVFDFDWSVAWPAAEAPARTLDLLASPGRSIAIPPGDLI